MLSTRSWLIGLPAVIGVAAVCLSLVSPPASPAAASGPDARVADLLHAFSSGNVIGGPSIWSSETAPMNQTVVEDFDAYSVLWVTVANVGSTSIDLRLTGGAAFATVAPHQTVTARLPFGSVGPPPEPMSLDFTATDVGAGQQTRVVWVVRQWVQ